MKRIAFLTVLAAMAGLTSFLYPQQVVVTDDASYTTAASGAVLDVKSTSKGFLPPRVALSSITDVTAISSPSTGLLVYNTATAGTYPSNVTPGYYYNAGTSGSPNWVKAMINDLAATNGMTLQDDGSPLLNGTATNWDDYVVSPNLARNSGTSVPGWTLFVNPDIFTWQFSATADQSIDFSVQLPHCYKVGSTVYPHIHWAPMTAAGANRVLWKLDYQWVNLGSAFATNGSTSITGYNVVVAGSGVESSPTRSLAALECCITPVGSGIAGTGMGISSILMCRLTRVGSDATDDNYSGLAALLSIDFHYERDSFGSRTEYGK